MVVVNNGNFELNFHNSYIDPADSISSELLAIFEKNLKQNPTLILEDPTTNKLIKKNCNNFR